MEEKELSNVSQKETTMHDLGESNKIKSLLFRKGVTSLTNKNFHGVSGQANLDQNQNLIIEVFSLPHNVITRITLLFKFNFSKIKLLRLSMQPT